MYKILNANVTLVTDAKGFEDFLDEVVPVNNSVMTDIHRTVRPRLPRPVEYPTLVSTSPATGMLFTPISEINNLLNGSN